MNKNELVRVVAEETNHTKADVKQIIEVSLKRVTEELVKGEKVHLVGFGTFEVRQRVARDGRNPKTGQKIRIEATRTPSFLAGKALKDYVKGKR